MKVGGVENDRSVTFGPVTFKRGKDKFLAFYAQPVWDLEEFHARCAPPVNRNYVFTKAGKQLDSEAPAYLTEMKDYYRKRWGYIVMKSLEPSQIEWTQVNPVDPNTWPLVEPELKAELSVYEFAQVMTLVEEANALDAAKLQENAESFFQLQAQLISQKSQSGEAENSKSSALASASE